MPRRPSRLRSNRTRRIGSAAPRSPCSSLLFLTQASLGFAVYRANYWLAAPLVLISSHLMHGMLIGFHEASHGLLRKSRLLNEIDGIIIGIFSLMSFSLTARRINCTTPPRLRA